MKRKIKTNDIGSIYGAAVFLGVLGFTSFLVLLFGHILEPFFSIMRDGVVKTFLAAVFPNGVLLVVLIVMSFTVLMYYQKKFYQTGGESS